MISYDELLDSLREYHLLEDEQLTEVMIELQSRYEDPQSLTEELTHRGWLTSYQAERIIRGEGKDLALGPYVLQERIGEGGMGEVYKAIHRILKSVRAIKIILPECLTSRAAIDRFYREMELVSRLKHPNIILAHDAGQQGNIHYFVMEYAAGQDLARLLRRGPLPYQQACDYVRQAAMGLQHAHEKGLIHRDIKPSNLLLTEDGIIKILDLGLARLRDPAAHGNSDDSPLTPSGAMVGTPDFMAPEQGDDPTLVDIRADIYALGGSFYQLLTGRLPFPGGSHVDKLIAHRTAHPVPVSELRPDVPPALGNIINKMMAKSPSQRYQSPREVVAALKPFVQGETASIAAMAPPIGAPPSESHTRNLSKSKPAASDQFPKTLLSGDSPLPMPEEDSRTEVQKPWRRSEKRPPVGWLIGGGLVAVLAVGLSFVLFPRGGSHSTRTELAEATRKEPGRGAPTKKEVPPPGKKDDPIKPKKDPGPPKDDKPVKDKKKDEKPVEPPVPPPPPKKIDRAKSAPKGTYANGKKINDQPNAIARGGSWKRVEELYSFGRSKASRAAFSSNGQRLAIVLGSGMRLLDLGEKAEPAGSYEVGSLLGLQSVGTGPDRIALSPDGNQIAFTTVAFSKDPVRGNPKLSVKYDTLAVIEDGKTHLFYGAEAQGESNPLLPSIYSLTFRRGSKDKAILTSSRQQISLWNLGQFEHDRPVKTYQGRGYITAMGVAPSGKFVVGGSSNGTLSLFQIDSKGNRPYCVFEGHKGRIGAIAFVDESLLLSGDSTGEIRLWKIPEEKAEKAMAAQQIWKEWHRSLITALAVSPQGRRFLSGDETGAIRLVEIEKPEPLWEEQASHVLAAGFTQNGFVHYCTTGNVYRRLEIPLTVSSPRPAPQNPESHALGKDRKEP